MNTRPRLQHQLRFRQTLSNASSCHPFMATGVSSDNHGDIGESSGGSGLMRRHSWDGNLNAAEHEPLFVLQARHLLPAGALVRS